LTVCFDGIQNDRSCSVGKHFSFFENSCVDPFLADCNLDYLLCKDSISSGIPVFVANPRDCNSYFVCVGEQAVALNCAKDYHFVPSKGCEPIEQANCTVSCKKQFLPF
jgi:Chitin binding Peritrophin-A domain